jgi:hypothetical protein
MRSTLILLAAVAFAGLAMAEESPTDPLDKPITCVRGECTRRGKPDVREYHTVDKMEQDIPSHSDEDAYPFSDVTELEKRKGGGGGRGGGGSKGSGAGSRGSGAAHAGGGGGADTSAANSMSVFNPFSVLRGPILLLNSFLTSRAHASMGESAPPVHDRGFVGKRL